jgi:tRNA modification GTPase
VARNYLDAESPIVALATPQGRGALAVVRTSGPGAIELCDRCFRSPQSLSATPGYSLTHGFAVDPETGEKIDDAIAAVFRAPRSFTGQDSVEFSCHGSPAVVDKLLATLRKAGFKQALPGEFSFRAFANGKTDLVEAEAINELAGAKCESARADALARLSGVLSSEYDRLRESILDLLAQIEARLDYAEEEGPDESFDLAGKFLALQNRLESLSASYIGGKLRQEGALVVISGRPNAGKSSLFNLIVREERAIVSPDPGTTRDWLESWIEIGGYAVRLVDTAGLRAADAPVEAEGVRRSLELSRNADSVLYIVDGSAGCNDEDEEFLAAHPRAIRIWNKTDIPSCPKVPEGWIGLSSKSGSGLAALESVTKASLDEIASSSGDARAAGSELRLASLRQKELVDACLASVRAAVKDSSNGAPMDAISLHLREAADALGQITGEISGEEVFERIFGAFCLGK